MIMFKIIIDCVIAIGAIATAGAFLYVIKGQKGAQEQIRSLSNMSVMLARQNEMSQIQIDSLSKMATTFTRQYEISRIQAGSTIYPNVKIALKHDAFWGMKIIVKNNSYPIEIYRIIVNTGSDNIDIRIEPREAYITAKQGETKVIMPGQIGRHPIYAFVASIKLFLITPFDEAYEIRYSTDGGTQQYLSEPIPIMCCPEDHQSGDEPHYTVNSYSVRGNVPGTVEDNFPEINKEFENDI